MTTNREPKLVVDFNNDDDHDVIRASRKRASDPGSLYVGQQLRLEDGEGNACLGTVVKLNDAFVWARADYTTWIDGQPLTLSLIDDLETALRSQLHISSSSGTAATTELV